ncbi:hypothetical protein [Novosphingobium sp. BL-8H]|uniref:hypothetical protein n=1 Tax=unclassified Novosphingobium TaxID=2644732 RepID=UPI003756D4FA
MTASAAAVKAGGTSNFAAEIERATRASLFVFLGQNRLLRRRFAAHRQAGAALTATAPTVGRQGSSKVGDALAKEAVMVAQVSIGVAAQRVMEKLVAGLEIEFGHGAGAALAARFMEAEESDFVWDARVCERWLGTLMCDGDCGSVCDCKGPDGEWFELDRVAIVGCLDGAWYAAVSIVDGDGRAHGLMARRACASEGEAREAYAALR